MKRIVQILVFISTILFFLFFLDSFGGQKSIDGLLTTIKISSSAFNHGEKIPSKYTCDGNNISPGLIWNETPENVETFVIIAEDPDAPSGTWVHWVIYNIPKEVNTLPESISAKKALDNGAQQGMTSFKDIGYGGPCPPSDTHRYYFRIYALDKSLSIKPENANRETILKAIEGHVLATGELMGIYNK